MNVIFRVSLLNNIVIARGEVFYVDVTKRECCCYAAIHKQQWHQGDPRLIRTTYCLYTNSYSKR